MHQHIPATAFVEEQVRMKLAEKRFNIYYSGWSACGAGVDPRPTPECKTEKQRALWLSGYVDRQAFEAREGVCTDALADMVVAGGAR